jgi:eukaryotic-like serine/threonine-protein kinase
VIDDPTVPASRRGDAASLATGDPTLPSTPAAIDRLAVGQRFGRFEVRSVLGVGGMGVVFAAYDPMLDREVAIKVVATEQGVDDTAAEERMVREAKAMAKLSHPNVVRVFEAGTSATGVFFVMELIAGTTLARWSSEPRPWADVLAHFIAAGRGLAAAHARGFVHRDFKPANVLMGDDGRILVSDFGLVSVATRAVGSTAAVGVDRQLDLSSGVILGTPRYMAPEQHRQAAVDHRADQWAYCAGLYEALYRERPFAGDTRADVILRLESGVAPVPSDERDVPKRMRAILQRGLARDPDRRYSSMDGLLSELAHDPSLRRRRWMGLGAIAILTGVAALGWMRDRHQASRHGPCDERVDGEWSDVRREQVRARFQSVPAGTGADTFARVDARLRSYLDSWTTSHATVCTAADQSTAQFHAQLACLAQSRTAVSGLVSVFATVDDSDVIDAAVGAVASLPAPASCEKATAPRRAEPRLSSGQQLQAMRVQAQLQRVDTWLRAGMARNAVAESERALAAAAAIHIPEIEAAAWLALGRSRTHVNANADAEHALRQAAQIAAKIGDDDIVAEAWTELLWVISRENRAQESLAMAELVADMQARAGSPPRLRAKFLFYRGSAYVELGEYQQAIPLLQRADAVWRDEIDPNDPERARVFLTLGNVAHYQSDLAQSAAYYQQALALRESALGRMHPLTVSLLGNLASVNLDLGLTELGLEQCRRQLAVDDDVLGATAGARIITLKCIGVALTDLGRLDEARTTLDAALASGEASGGRASYLPYVLTALANVESRAGRIDRAAALIDRANITFEAHPDRARMVAVRALILNQLGRRAEALAILDDTLATKPGPAYLAALRFSLAQVLWSDPRQRVRAIALATQARTGFEQIHFAVRLTEVTAWLAERVTASPARSAPRR